MADTDSWIQDRERRAGKARTLLYAGLLLVGLGFAVIEALLDEAEEECAAAVDQADDALRARLRDRERHERRGYRR